jgi:RNase P/RNase MRP subunit POP5
MAYIGLKQLDPTLTGSMKLSGSLEVTGSVGLTGVSTIGLGDTYIDYTQNDEINFWAGGERLLKLDEAGDDEVVVGDSGHVNFRVATSGVGYNFYVKSDNSGGVDNSVGIRNSSPQSVLDVTGDLKVSSSGSFGDNLTVTGDISASGDLFIQNSASFGGANSSIATVTVSGSISASGNLYLEGFINASGPLWATHITASGNISASGDLYVGGDISASGQITAYDDIEVRDGSVSGDTLVKLHNSSDDGIVSVYRNNLESIKLDGLTGNITASGNISASGATFYGGEITTAIWGTDLVKLRRNSANGIVSVYRSGVEKIKLNGYEGSISASGGMTIGIVSSSTNQLTVNGMAETKLYDDTLVKLHNSVDDGIVSVYQNNTEVIKLSGTDGSISASGDLVQITNITSSGIIKTVYDNDDLVKLHRSSLS